jgi:hypothetical protein
LGKRESRRCTQRRSPRNNDAAVTTDGKTGGEQEIHPERSYPVKLNPAHEKTPRGSFHPGVVFPGESSESILNYDLHIRPAIMHRARRTREDKLDRDRSFLVHTETGRALSRTNLRSALRRYVTAVTGLKANLLNVTVMTLRA